MPQPLNPASTNTSKIPRTGASRAGIAFLVRVVSRPVVGVTLLLCMIAIPHALTLLYQIESHYDDAWYASRAWAVIHTGWAYGPLDNGPFNNYEGHQTYYWLAGSWIDSIFVRILGPTLLAVRFTSFLFGLALLAILYAIARKLYSHRGGILTILIGAFSYPFIYSSHVGRQDIMVATLGYGAIALYMYQESTTLSFRSFISGLAVGITLDIHPTGMIFLPAIVALLLFDYRSKAWRSGRAWCFLAGFLCAVGYFVVVHVLPYPETYFAIGRLQQGSGITSAPITQVDPSAWLSSFVGLFNILGLPSCLLGALSLAILLRKPLRSDLRLALVVGVLVCAMCAIVARKPAYYAILIAPIIWMLLAAAADRVLQIIGCWRTSRTALVRSGIVIAAVCLPSLGNLPFLLQNHYSDFEAAMSFVRRSVPAGTSAIGEQTYWFARPDDPYYAWEQFVYFRRYQPGSHLDDALTALRPDYIIMDGLTEAFLVPGDRVPYMDAAVNVAISREEMELFLDRRTTLVAQAANSTFGHIRIYKINW